MTHWVLGIDEVGRGPLAGPVGVGVFALPASADQAALNGIRDSKALTAKAREDWVELLRSHSRARHAVSLVGPRYIDQHGIAPAIRTALKRSLTKLALDPVQCTVYLDGGLKAPEHYADQHTIIRGDSSVPLIAAAAILAKVRRDRYMERMANRYPEYGFAQHKGYGTHAHRTAIGKHGLSPLHRASFCTRIVEQP
jgi:ribonuclease HII